MAVTTPNMGLTSWDLLTDSYDHSELAANFTAIDLHDHSSGKGVRLGTNSLLDSSITTPKIADGAITATKIASGAVGSGLLDKSYIHPIGKIMPWWRPNGSTPVPTGWEIPVGQSLTSSQHDFAGGGTIILPDLTNCFLLGANTSGTGIGTSTPPDIGYAGGSHTVNLAHTHTVNSHSHSVNPHSHTVNSHDHNGATGGTAPNTNPAHSHNYALGPVAINGGGPNNFFVPNGTAGVQVFHSHSVQAHTHAIVASAPGTTSVGLTTQSASPGTGSTLSATTDIRPKFVGILFLIKVKH